MRIFDTQDTAGRIGEVLGTLVAIGVYCLGAHTVLVTLLR
jgi:hypothetical protein